MLLRKSLKILGIFWLILFAFKANATNYYLSNSGNDANSGTDPSAAWQTLNKLNSFKNLKPGDNVLFKRGDTFYGSITVSNSGTAGNPITYGAYDAGEKPVISGFTTVSKWTNLGGNIWESTDPVSTLSTCNMLVINGVNTAMGRYPNLGYLTFQTHSSNSITSNQLSRTPNWTGAEMVIRSSQFTLDRMAVTTQAGSSLIYSGNLSHSLTNGFGFFIQNDIKTLDQQNEWYYNPSTKKIDVYSTSSPIDIRVSTIDILVSAHGSYVTFDNITFTGANSYAFYNDWGAMPNVTIQNCTIDFSGISAIRVSALPNFKIENNNILNSNNNGIDMWVDNPHAIIRDNTIQNSGILPGMGQNGMYSRMGIAPSYGNTGNGLIAEYNKVINSGYMGIDFASDSALIKNNYVDTFCTVLQDGGGIYTNNEGFSSNGSLITGNIILNGIGNSSGTAGKQKYAEGIYIDGNSANIEVANNTIANCSDQGLYIHDSKNINAHNNTIYNNSVQLSAEYDGVFYQVRGCSIINNIFVAQNTNPPYLQTKQLAARFISTTNDISLFGTIDSNYYARPIDDNLTFSVSTNAWGSFTNNTLSDWQKYLGQDAHSHKSPKSISDTTDLRFEYNATTSNKTINLDANYIDVRGVGYKGIITLTPFASAVLIKNGDFFNKPPIAKAGSNQSINLPTNSVTVSGSGSDSDGTITSFQWKKISGPSAFNIANASFAATAISGLVRGNYQFELNATDDKGGVGKDTVQITVNAAANIPPTANAGTNETMILPTNTISLFGTGTDTDGTISIHSWTKISGPSGATINNADSATATVNNLSEGVYQFEITVTDDKGAVGKDTVQVTVNAAPNVPPTANAGPNQAITLPTNTIHLTGSGTDPDGSIASYQWTQVSGPNSGTINNGNSASSIVNNLAEGVYQFELKVTDNKGAVGKDTVQVTVNAAPNVPPKANAGTDETVGLPTNSISLSGSGTDGDGSNSSFSWTKISGPTSGTINNVNSASAIVNNLSEGVYLFELTVTDDKGATGKDTVQITVNAALNHPPTADAGTNQTVTLPTNTISLSGSGTDADGNIASYQWTKIAGPNNGTINNGNSFSASVNNLAEGVYLFELKVTDDKGAVGRDTMQITVNAAPNMPPMANADKDQSITLPTNTVSLSGNGTDTDGTISAYLWTKISGPSGGTINNANSASAAIGNLSKGVYQFELTIIDDKGAPGKDTVQITVNAAPNLSPTAYAGTDKIITLPTNSVSLSGSGNDSDGTISTYSWTKISGPTGETINNSDSASPAISNLLGGVYKLELTVTDDKGAIAKDTIQIMVNAAPNIPPIANAGGGQTITLPANTVTLSANGTDSDGTISSYSWTKISGPSGGTINNSNSPSAIVNNLTEGVYQFELKDSDDKGAVGKDTVQITVNAAANISPTTNTGRDQTITLPNNTVSLFGNGTDPDGTISSYSWTKISGPSTFSIKNASFPTSQVSGLVEGVYLFELKVTDNSGATANDTVMVTVRPALNIPPVANAGSNQTITLPTNSIYLNGNGVDGDGTISSYLWTKISEPDAGTITNASSALTAVKGLVPGNYIFQFTVTDNRGGQGKDSVYVKVYPPINIAPTANAGGDLTIVLPTNTVYLNGSGNDADGTITAYHWKQVAGPDSASIAANNNASTEVKNLVGGTYEFELTVTDNNERTGKDTVSVEVALGRVSSPQNSINVYPNPVKDIANVEISSESLNTRLTLVIYDFAGKIVYRKQTKSSDYKATEKINMSTFAKGFYTISVFFNVTDKRVLPVIKL